MAAVRWQWQRQRWCRHRQRRDCGGFTGTVHECADAHTFERHRRVDVHVFVLGQGRRDNSADGIVVVGSDGGARGDVHRGCQCAAAADNDAANKDTADADGNGDRDDIVC